MCDPAKHTYKAGVRVGRETWPRYRCCGHRVHYPGWLAARTRDLGIYAKLVEPIRRIQAQKA